MDGAGLHSGDAEAVAVESDPACELALLLNRTAYPGPHLRSNRYSRKDKEDVSAPTGIIRPNGECYGHHTRLSLCPSHPIELVVEAASQEKSHHESRAGNLCSWRLGAYGQWRKCTTQDRQSNSRSASVAYIPASLWVWVALSLSLVKYRGESSLQ
jgi:hypothetical protein